MWEGLLPIGSVVILKNTKQKMMICGICQQVEEENGGVLYDYSALLHPYGYVSKDYLYVFNQESIEKVCSIGYIDERLIAAYKNVRGTAAGRTGKDQARAASDRGTVKEG